MGAGDVPAEVDARAAAALLLTTPCGVEAPGEAGTSRAVTGEASRLALRAIGLAGPVDRRRVPPPSTATPRGAERPVLIGLAN